MTERKLATIEVVSAVTPIPGADNIEAVTVRNWTVVTKRGEFRPGDPCVYIEIDTALPLDRSVFEFLASRGSKTIDGKQYHVLKTAKLRGVYSQGLVLPLDAFSGTSTLLVGTIGTDVSEELGLFKYEPPIPANLAGTVVGPFPTAFCRKTDAERVQNLSAEEYAELRTAADWFATEKIDGTSATFIKDGARLRVCGRNWEYAEESGNTLWRIARELDIESWMTDGMAIQGEVFGEGIQGNPLKMKGQHLAVFSVWHDRDVLADWPTEAIPYQAPTYFDLELPETIEEAIAQADGIESLRSPGRKAEGIVWHAHGDDPFPCLDNRTCFKVISNKYLLKADR